MRSILKLNLDNFLGSMLELNLDWAMLSGSILELDLDKFWDRVGNSTWITFGIDFGTQLGKLLGSMLEFILDNLWDRF